MKNSFSLIEILFTITIISILLVVIIPKLFYNLNNANIIKLSSDIAIIRNSIIKYTNKQTLQNKQAKLETLDDYDNNLFKFILDYPIIENNKKSGTWIQTSGLNYQAWINQEVYVNFIYNPNTLTFDCDITEKYCRELTQ